MLLVRGGLDLLLSSGRESRSVSQARELIEAHVAEIAELEADPAGRG